MQPPTLRTPTFPGSVIAISGDLSVRGVAEVLDALTRAPRESPVQLDLREARIAEPALLALAHGVWRDARRGLRLDGLDFARQRASPLGFPARA